MFANEDVQELKLLEDSIESSSLTQTSYSSNNRQPQSKKTYSRFSSTKDFQPTKSVFFQTNIGVGFLYFSGLRGNLMGKPVVNFTPATIWRDAPIEGRLSYNRTPLFEYLLGYRFNPWLKLALSYQHQGGITVQSKAVSAFPNNTSPDTEVVQFTSNLSLDALLAKVYFELPYAMIWRNLSVNPYLAAGVGPGWQSWTHITTNYTRGNNFFVGEMLPLRQKISANAVWMIDMGLRLQKASSSNQFSVVAGCKYNQWGQARSIGKMTQQGAHKLALTQPIRIKTVYQFAPYLGVQWNFSAGQSLKQVYKLKENSPKVYFPWIASREFQCPSSIWTQFNAGVGFLYFSGLRGNLMGALAIFFAPPTSWRDAPLKGHLSYNRTPLFEYLLGYRFNPWLKLAFSYQSQGGIAIQSKAVLAFPNNTFPSTEVVQFTSNLSLDALLAKVYFELPYAMIWRNLSTNPYLAVGVGPGWQSWTNIQINYMLGNATFQNDSLPLRQKVSANAVWMLDAGLRIQSTSPENVFSMLLGCKYNQWGQARSIGKMTQQGAHKLALFKPLRVKTVYQFAPYLGVQWNFTPDRSAGSSYRLKGKSPRVWLPYWVASREFQCQNNIWTQFNVGIGFLYFSGLQANLIGKPLGNFSTDPTAVSDAPPKRGLSYNRTPLFEYLLGYQFNSWLKLALSYQSQRDIAIQSKAISAYLPTPNAAVTTQTIQFTSNLSLNALLAKIYLELPFSMIWRSLSMNPYLAAGVGPGWQTWSRNTVNYMLVDLTFAPAFSEVSLSLRQKVSANAVWMIDAGFRIQSAYPNSKFSVLLGCKYNQWGQARSIGKMTQQGAHKLALSRPLRIKTVYQFAPYLGVQWNF